MENKINKTQPRFFCIKVTNVSKINFTQFTTKKTQQNVQKQHKRPHQDITNTQKHISQRNFRLIFQIGPKKSYSKFKANKPNKNYTDIVYNDLLHVQQQMHIISYEYEQVMSIKLILQGQDKKYGYALMPLNPLIKIPHTCHQIDLNLVFQTQNKQIINRISAVVQLNLFYLLKFEGVLFIQPLQAHLTKNQAGLGQMKPFIKLKVKDKLVETKTIQQGGIRPVWKQKMSKQHELYLFNLQSAADELQITVQHTSMITNSLQEVGRATIQIQDKKIFKNSKSIASIARNYLKGVSREDKAKRVSRIKQKLNEGDKLKSQQKAFMMSTQFQKQLQLLIQQGSFMKFQQKQLSKPNNKQRKDKTRMKSPQKSKNQQKQDTTFQLKHQLQVFKSYFIKQMLDPIQIDLFSFDLDQDQDHVAGFLTLNMGFLYTFQLDQNDTFKTQWSKDVQIKNIRQGQPNSPMRKQTKSPTRKQNKSPKKDQSNITKKEENFQFFTQTFGSNQNKQ